MGKWANRLAIKSSSALHMFKHHSLTLAWVSSSSLCEAVTVASEVRNLQPQWDRQLSGLGELPASWRLELLSEMLGVLGSRIPSLKHVVWVSKCHKWRNVASYIERNQMLGPNLPSQGPRNSRAVSHPALDSRSCQLLRTWA